MAKIKPFKAVRPVSDKVHLVASRSYVSYSNEKLKEKLDTNPFTFIHIINPDYNNPEPASAELGAVFPRVKERYAEFLENDIFLKDDADSIYIYTQKTPTHSYTGIIAGVSVEEYTDKKIKIHEATIERREELFTNYLDIVDFNAEPVLLSYPKNMSCSELMDNAKQQPPIYNFTTADAVQHKLWKVDSPSSIKEFKEAFEHIPELYIADGHHRSASSVNLSKKRNNSNTEANSNWFMAMITPEDEMEIFGFHRLLKGFTKSETDKFVNEINTVFDLEHVTGDPFSPNPGEVHMYYFGTGWTKFKFNPELSQSPKSHLDAQLLSDQILKPIVGIKDLKTDKRIKFIPAKNNLQEIVDKLDDGNELFFLLAPVTFDQLKAVADADEFMPPKSTYIEPKLRSGLTIFEISDE